ncbi:cytochrome P450 [Mycobacterium sp. CBMA271]|uniref:cytochrome P450 n=1 Tax=unclassified Mycobacteroides TaxID=2618759 RepID=UPI0012DD56A0|nr:MULTISPECIES: cytochrome P450 [unclassified Mycobacteroides]MUM17733.1 cytochrome [Mycobacteroides sp. CBMA 326]MUM22992.1 cytochrome P450 [Mycobacteroides sp. CBMA 271]
MTTVDSPDIRRLPWNATNPYPYYEDQRRRGAVIRDDANEVWLVLGYRAARQVLSDAGWTSDATDTPQFRDLTAVAGPDMFSSSMLFSDGDNHRRLRGSVRDVFTSNFIGGLRDGIEAIASAAIAQVPVGTTVDFMSEIALPLPIAVVSAWLDLEPDSSRLLRDESPAIARMLGALGPSETAAFDAGIGAFMTLMTELLPVAADRRGHPGEDLISHLAADANLELEDVVVTAVTIAVAGHETTANLLGTAMLRLLTPFPDGSRLLDQCAGVDNALITELLRLDGPVQAVGRVATQRHDLDGAHISIGEQALVIIAAANRDPDIFDNPTDFRPSRGGPLPLSFGYGAHHCLGNALARLETEIALRGILARDPVLAGPPVWRDTPAIRGPVHLPVAFRC